MANSLAGKGRFFKKILMRLYSRLKLTGQSLTDVKGNKS